MSRIGDVLNLRKEAQLFVSSMDLPYRPEMPRKMDGGAPVLADSLKYLKF